VTTESESEKIDTLAEIEGVAETGNGTETEALQGVMHEGTMMTDHRGGTEICSMTEEGVAGVEVAEEVTVTILEEGEESARRVHHLHPRRRSRPQT
jgi:hypothetical protein